MAFQPTKSRAGVDHTGKSKAFAKPGEPALAIHHDPNIARQHDRPMTDNIATRGKPKVLHPVALHNSATRRQVELKGMGHPIGSAPDASAANPLDKTASGKTFAPAAPVIGQRSRSADSLHGARPGENHARNVGRGADSDARDLGARILDEAFAASAPDDRFAHGRKP
jgi:hypothetical protein